MFLNPNQVLLVQQNSSSIVLRYTVENDYSQFFDGMQMNEFQQELSLVISIERDFLEGALGLEEKRIERCYSEVIQTLRGIKGSNINLELKSIIERFAHPGYEFLSNGKIKLFQIGFKTFCEEYDLPAFIEYQPHLTDEENNVLKTYILRFKGISQKVHDLFTIDECIDTFTHDIL